MRAHVAFNFVTELLKDGLNFTEAEYQQYLNDLEHLTDQKKISLRATKTNKLGLLKQLKYQQNEIALALTKIPSESKAYRLNLTKVDQLETQITELEASVKTITAKLESSDTDKLSVEEFLNLSKKAHLTVQSGDAYVKDAIIRIIFSNLTFGDGKITTYQLKEPFATLLKDRFVLNGRIYGMK